MASSAPPPGTADIFAAEARRYSFLERTAAAVFSRYGYGELRTPIFEYTEVFQRGLGDDTEVVQKEMYTFLDRGGRSLTLRPEGTAGIMRALLNTDVRNGVEQRVYYHGPMFRGERPAAGRRRQFHQVGVENAGRVAPELDAENIAMLMHYLDELAITGSELRINSRGVAADRSPAGELLKAYFSQHRDRLCPDCHVRLEKNIWRILDCKQAACRSVIDRAPDYFTAYTAESQAYFAAVTAALDALDIPYTVDRHLVRGLDYYVHTVFEVTHDAGLGAQNAIAGGGRYELYLPGESKPLHGVGFAAGMERLLLTQDALGLCQESVAPPPVFLAALGEAAQRENLRLAAALRRAGIAVALEYEPKSMKAQLRSANRVGAAAVVIRGDDELASGVAVVKSMATGEQETVPAAALGDYLKHSNRQ